MRKSIDTQGDFTIIWLHQPEKRNVYSIKQYFDYIMWITLLGMANIEIFILLIKALQKYFHTHKKTETALRFCFTIYNDLCMICIIYDYRSITPISYP